MLGDTELLHTEKHLTNMERSCYNFHYCVICTFFLTFHILLFVLCVLCCFSIINDMYNAIQVHFWLTSCLPWEIQYSWMHSNVVCITVCVCTAQYRRKTFKDIQIQLKNIKKKQLKTWWICTNDRKPNCAYLPWDMNSP